MTGLRGKMANLLARDSIRYKGSVLPARHLRLCGAKFQDDEHFLSSAKAEAARLARDLAWGPSTRLLEIGCGVGRLPIGILARSGDAGRYTGVDVDERCIGWCLRHITRSHPAFRFVHTDVRNARYNPDGSEEGSRFRLPFEDAGFDLIYLYSVFSHMEEVDVRAYLKEFRRLLAPSGHVFLTAFVEEGVPAVSVNPPGYRMKWSGPLHGVRYERRHFESIIGENGLVLDRLDYGTETDGQSGLYISRRGTGEGKR